MTSLTWELSFGPYLRFLERQLATCHNPTYSAYLQRIIDLINQDERLTQPIHDWGILQEHRELIELLKLNHVYPFEADKDLMYALGVPSPLRFFSYSPSFAALALSGHEGEVKLQPCGPHSENEKVMQGVYREVLHRSYEVPREAFGTEPAEFMTLEENCQPCNRYYRLVSNHQFMEVRWVGQKPPLRHEWLEFAQGNVQRVGQLQEPLPLHDIVIEGFIIFKLKDETEEESLLRLNSTLVNMHALPERQLVKQMVAATSTLLGTEKVRLGFLPFVQVNKQYVYHDSFASTSILFNQLREHHTSGELERIFRTLFSYCSSRRLLNTDIYYDAITGREEEELPRYLYKYGIRSMAFFPVYHKSELIGMIEIGSTEPGLVNLQMRRKVERAVPMYREFLLYLQDKFQQMINNFILRRYTAIHPSMLWRFREAAWEALRQVPRSGSTYVPTPPIRFDDLVPFYAAVDIRNSSVERLHATRTDLLLQLEALHQLIPASMQELRSATNRWQRQLGGSTSLEDELNVSEHLQLTVEQLLEQGINTEAVAAFKAKLQDGNSDLHQTIHRYEESIEELNKKLKRVLMLKEQQLQGVLPYYMDRFQTDGLEYSLYVGRSVAPELKYKEQESLSDVIAWQLHTIVEMAQVVHNLQEQLPYPLQTTQLLLVHLHKVNLSFRPDERIFDVDGAYSIRYEVIKKRIDKVHLLNSDERLTQPGTIAVVYANEQELEMYKVQYEKLMQEGKLKPEAEYLELEPLQGIAGLKAVRLHITL
ncbi:GAF domain-containing protein [Pontibacter actiniarum]|uniref:GAF domain-containing protein n=2 Tax=Pontibacter actiniarum TaxID=323450 RepID=A0A1X9YTY4_9BACT|nr:GAF domain-containing protein [Pontibacter actiniarum]